MKQSVLITHTILTLLIGSIPSLHSAEQDNWYLAKEWSVSSAQGVAYRTDPSTGTGQVYVVNTSTDKMEVFDLNGTKIREVTGFYNPYDVAVGADGTTFVASRNSVKAHNANGSQIWSKGSGSGDGQFNYPYGIALHPTTGEVFIADRSNYRVQVLASANGSFLRKFGSQGSAPSEFSSMYDLAFLPDGTLLVSGYELLHFYKADGTFIQRVSISYGDPWVSSSPDGTIMSRSGLLDSKGDRLISNPPGYSRRTAWTDEGDLIVSTGSKVQIYKRTYRTKGLPTRNIVPLPKTHKLEQRAGTNIIDFDFEIIDADDPTATVGLLAAVDGKFDNMDQWIVPKTFVDGTGAKLGTPIATNSVHRISWNVKSDWTEPTGTIKLRALSRDARRSRPVDIHFLKLPLNEGTLTISRSPIKDADMINYFQYLIATRSSSVVLEKNQIKDVNGSTLLEYDINQSPSQKVTRAGRNFFMNALGFRWASIAELSIAREAATPGTVNQWSATNQVTPRNLPSQINEYGFDVGNHGTRAWWVVKESSLSIPTFTATSFDTNGSENHNLGRSVAISGTKVVVGSSHSGSLHFYEINANGTSLTDKGIIQPTSDHSNMHRDFGSNGPNKLKGDQLAVGTPQAYTNSSYSASSSGAVYIFDLSGNFPSQKQRLTASDGARDDYFGRSVDLDGDFLVAGAPGEDPDGLSSAGSAYLFKRGSNGQYSQTAKLLPEESEQGANFGQSVSVANGIIAVGAPYQKKMVNGTLQNYSGAVHLYKTTDAGAVTLTQKIFSPGSEYNGRFGNALAMDGNKLVVGAYNTWRDSSGNNLLNGYNVGAVHIYIVQADGTAQLSSSIYSPTPRHEGYFGNQVALDGERLLVGAYREDSDNGSQSGVAYVYKVSTDGKTSLLERLTHPTGRASDNFGISVGVSGLNYLVGSPNYDLDNERWNAGSAVLFRASQ